MNKNMNSSSQFTDFTEFLIKHNAKNNDNPTTNNITHTRIPDKQLNIYGGSYIIPKEDLELFYRLYYEHVFENKNKEHITEKQLESGGPLVVDFDFRYNFDIDERLHTREHVRDMICVYLDEIKEFFIFDETSLFSIYIFEKPNVNRLEDKSMTKDGIHMLIGIKVDNIIQNMFREKMIKKLPEYWDLPFINNWESIIDDGISKGTTNWQLFGSRKPNNEAYELTHHYIITFDTSDGEFIMDEIDVNLFNLKNDFAKLTVRYDNNPQFIMTEKKQKEYNNYIENIKNNKSKKLITNKTKINLIIENDFENDEDINISSIKNIETLNKAVSIMLKNLKFNEYEIKEIHEYTQALPPKYYEPGSHLLNRQVAFALKNTDERLFLSWILLRSKANDFDFNTIPELYLEWKKFGRSNKNNETITKKSILYWVKKDNFEEYEKIKKSTIEYYMERAIETCTEYDLAIVLQNMYKDTYVCVSYDKRGIWYRFKNHRWILDKGLSLREKISKDMYDLFTLKAERTELQMVEYKDDDERHEFLKKKMKLIIDLKLMLKRTGHKDHIMREAAEIFYDGEFIKNIDTKKHLICFNNGVIDFENKIFRNGYPEDYITKSTKINYVEYDENNTQFMKSVCEIKEFMNKLFPINDLNKYMWQHLASCLIGVNKNQTFNVYHGSGSNGKSILADLMSATLGEYKGTVPITLVTESRNRIGGTSDEVLKLKGIRYAVMQEPSKGVKLNEGIMKELTGGDPIQARGLYSESEVFEPQFTLVVCTNNLFDIESNDDGTWRRIRKCDFPSKFIDEGENYNDETPYVFIKDKNLKDKFPNYAPVFASMLVKIAFETNGIVEDCETIINASKKYRKGQDHIAAFIMENIIKTNEPTDKIGKKGVYEEFKLWLQHEQGINRIPKGEELYEYMNKKFGEPTKKGWIGIKFISKDDDDDEITFTS
jgi:P4 family phage/plasmid primase-like protien